MNDFEFTIEEQVFSVVPEDLGRDAFTVRSTPRPYKVQWRNGENPAAVIVTRLRESVKNLLLIDRNVMELYFPADVLPSDRVFPVEATEEGKQISVALEIVDFLARNGFGKNDTLLVVGGGITEDLGAFVGAIYKRGIAWEYVPTTLLSMCDSCIGGKTGINYRETKNQLALFSAPRDVSIFPAFLGTLAEREIHSGLGEILKLLATGGNRFIQIYADACDPASGIPGRDQLKSLIISSLMIKRAVVEFDEFELNLRRALNYGHTLGHAIEALSDFRIPHGQAVALGMTAVNRIAMEEGRLAPAEFHTLRELAKPLYAGYSLDELSMTNFDRLLGNDKKTIGNRLVLVEIEEPGKTFFKEYPKNAETLAKLWAAIHAEGRK